MFHSQSGTIEECVLQLFPAPGFFLEIGCWDGLLISQTLYLEQQGWQGLCVDPFPRNFADRRCMLCPEAISADGKPREFLYVTVDRRNGGDVSYFSGFKDSLRAHLQMIEEFCDYTTIMVDTITIPQLYERYALPKFIEFLSVDTEGSELEILSSIDLNIYRFGLIAFEHNYDENVRKTIGRRLESYGYTFHSETAIDDVYVGAA